MCWNNISPNRVSMWSPLFFFCFQPDFCHCWSCPVTFIPKHILISQTVKECYNGCRWDKQVLKNMGVKMLKSSASNLSDQYVENRCNWPSCRIPDLMSAFNLYHLTGAYCQQWRGMFRIRGFKSLCKSRDISFQGHFISFFNRTTVNVLAA